MTAKLRAKWTAYLFISTSLLVACGQSVQFFGIPGEPTPARPSNPDDDSLPPESEDAVGENDTDFIDDIESIPPPRPTPSVSESFFLDYSFESTHHTLKTDIVWTIDNSTTMAEEAENVRRNFESFSNRLESVLDVKIGLISTSVTDTANNVYGVKMSDAMKAKGHFQYNVPTNLLLPPEFRQRGVGSWNLLAYAVMTNCGGLSIDITDLWRTVLCGHRSSNPGNHKLEDKQTIIDSIGKMMGFYRSDAKRIYIFVTDDETRHFKAVDFKTVLDAQIPNNYHTFAFVGDSNDPHCAKPSGVGHIYENEGLDYKRLAEQTGGKTYSICKPDWNDSFNSLLKSIYELTEESYPVPSSEEVVEVFLDDELLTTAQYLITDENKVYLKKGVLKNAGQKINIRTQVRSSN